MRRRLFVFILIMMVAAMCFMAGCGGSDKAGGAASNSENAAKEDSQGTGGAEDSDKTEETEAEAATAAGSNEEKSTQASVKIKIAADGKTQEIETPEGTVEDTLKLVGITVGKDDIVSPDLTSEVFDGTEVVITRVTFKEEEETVEVPYETEYMPDDTIYEGNSYYVQTGINGESINKYMITYHDGNEVSRELVSSTETVAAQTEVIAYGTLVYVASEESSEEYVSEGSDESGEEDPEICVPNDDNW